MIISRRTAVPPTVTISPAFGERANAAIPRSTSAGSPALICADHQSRDHAIMGILGGNPMPLSRLSRRGFIVALSSVPSWPTVAGAQQHLRRIAVLMAVRETDPDGQARLKALLQGLDTHGWREGKNMRTEVRWTDGTPEELRNAALHLVALKPDVIVANGSVGVAALKQTTSIIPVVFVVVNEPVAQGFITSMAHP